MKTKHWTLVIFLLLATWVADQATKLIALELIQGFHQWSFFAFVIHRNPGAMLGTFSSLPPILRIVSLSTGGAFLIFIYAAIQYILPKRSMLIRIGMSFLLGGILGNVTDRILFGSILDFIVIKGFGFLSPAFNIADAIQWVGYVLIIYSLIKDGNQFWPEINERKQIWVNKAYQIKYILVLITVGMGFAIISGVFSYTFIKITVDQMHTLNSDIHTSQFVHPFLLTYFIISISFVILLFIVGRIISHRTAGPIYAFENYVRDLLSGGQRSFKLRDGDEFTHLVKLGEDLQTYIKKVNQESPFDIRELLESSQDKNEKSSDTDKTTKGKVS